jgi:hypothetical protein
VNIKEKNAMTSIDMMDMDDPRSMPMDEWTVDRVEGDQAMVTNGEKKVGIPVDMLHDGAQPGDPVDDELGHILSEDPTGDRNLAEQEPDADDSMEPSVRIKPTQNMTRLR